MLQKGSFNLSAAVINFYDSPAVLIDFEPQVLSIRGLEFVGALQDSRPVEGFRGAQILKAFIGDEYMPARLKGSISPCMGGP